MAEPSQISRLVLSRQKRMLCGASRHRRGQHRLRFRETGEVPEVAVEAVGVVAVAVAYALGAVGMMAMPSPSQASRCWRRVEKGACFMSSRSSAASRSGADIDPAAAVAFSGHDTTQDRVVEQRSHLHRRPFGERRKKAGE